MRVTFALVASIVGLGSSAGDNREKAPMFKITTKRANDAVETQSDKDKSAFVVTSPSGIGQAIIERSDEKWPDVVMLRLRLKGLESFKASNGTVTLEVAVSSQNDGQRVRLWKDGKEELPLDSKSPFWTEIHMIGSDGKPANVIPLKDGYFEMTLPKALFEGNLKSITFNWIDFYR